MILFVTSRKGGLRYTCNQTTDNWSTIIFYIYVYLRNYYGTYLTMTIDELVENADKYNINAYFDKGSKYGGCIRIIVVSEK